MRSAAKAASYHLMCLAWLGVIPIKEGLLMQFFKQAPVSTRAEVARAVLMSLNRSESVPPKNLQRLQKFVEWRLECLMVSITDSNAWTANRDEIEIYPGWFESDHFSVEWRISCLGDYAAKVDVFRSSDFDIESLVRILPHEVNQVASVFLQLTEKLVVDDFMHWDYEDIKAIIRASLEHGNDKAKGDVRRAQDLLLKRGHSCLLNLED